MVRVVNLSSNVRGEWAKYQFGAFVSYTHEDLATAEWLEKELKSWRTPPELIGIWAPYGPVPSSLGDIFRDRSSGAAHHSLDGALKDALDASAALIVICSRDSARSEWVNNEISYFKAQGRGDRIFTLIVDGDPGGEEPDCFPEALLYPATDDGRIDRTGASVIPLATDVRPEADGPDHGFLKLMSSLLGVSLKDLRREDLKAQRNKRNLRASITGAIGIGALAVVLAIFAYGKVGQSNRFEEAAIVTLALQEIEEQNYSKALLLGLEGYHQDTILLPPKVDGKFDAMMQQALDRMRLTHQFTGQNVGIGSFAFSPDGQYVLSAAHGLEGGTGGIAQLRNLETNEVRALSGHIGEILKVDFSSDGRRAITATATGEVRVWDVETLQFTELEKHEGPVTTATFSPDGKFALTASKDKSAKVHNLETGGVNRLNDHVAAVNAAAFNSDASLVATASDDATARLWNLETGEVVILDAHGDKVNSAEFNSDDHFVVTASDDKSVRLWAVATGRSLVLEGHRGSVDAARFSADGSYVISSSADDRSARVWDLGSEGTQGHELIEDKLTSEIAQNDAGELAALKDTWRFDYGEPVLHAEIDPTNRYVMTTSPDGKARIWDLDFADGGKPQILSHEDSVEFAHFGLADITVPSGTIGARLVMTGSSDGVVRVWNIGTVKSNPDHDEDIASAGAGATHFIPGQNSAPHGVTRAVGGGVTGRYGQQKQVLSGHEDWVQSASFSPDGSQVVTSSADGTARIWDLRSRRGSRPRILKHKQSVEAASFSPDGQLVVTASLDGSAKIWGADGPEEDSIRTFKHFSAVDYAAFDPSGRSIVTTSREGKRGTARLWDLRSSEGSDPMRIFKHTYRVALAIFSPDGHRLATVASGQLFLWDIETGEWLWRDTERNYVTSLDINPDGTRLVAGLRDGRTQILDLASGRPLTILSAPRQKVSSGKKGNSISSATFSPNGKWIVTASSTGVAQVWNAGTGEILETIEHQDGVRSARFSPDGRHVVTASWDNTGKILDLETSRIRILEGHSDVVTSAEFSADGRYVVTASRDNTAMIWSVSSGSRKEDPLKDKGDIVVVGDTDDGEVESSTTIDDMADGETGDDDTVDDDAADEDVADGVPDDADDDLSVADDADGEAAQITVAIRNVVCDNLPFGRTTLSQKEAEEVGLEDRYATPPCERDEFLSRRYLRKKWDSIFDAE